MCAPAGPLLGQVCHVEPASIAPYAGGVFWVWHSNNRMQAVYCKLLCLKSLFLRGSLFSFVVCPIPDIPPHHSCWQGSRETCKVTAASFIFLCITLIPSSPSPILSPAAVRVVIQLSRKTKVFLILSLAQTSRACAVNDDLWSLNFAFVTDGRALCLVFFFFFSWAEPE